MQTFTLLVVRTWRWGLWCFFFSYCSKRLGKTSVPPSLKPTIAFKTTYANCAVRCENTHFMFCIVQSVAVWIRFVVKIVRCGAVWCGAVQVLIFRCGWFVKFATNRTAP